LNTQQSILITGAAGFIGSCMAHSLHRMGYPNLMLCDDFTLPEKKTNYESLTEVIYISRNEIFNRWNQFPKPALIIHLGARTDTTEMDEAIHQKLNLEFSKQLWALCCSDQIPLIYASSAATYGHGESGYSDDHRLIPQLKPLNPYGWSKQRFDEFVLSQHEHPPFWYGLKFFNVYGPNEYHKKRMASVIFHAYHQIRQQGYLKLFRSHHPDFKDGEQLRDFIYVKDVLSVIHWLMKGTAPHGIYNLGTGKAETFLHLARSVFQAMQVPESIEFIDTPIDIRDKYQYYTCAEMEKLQTAGYSAPFTSLQDGVFDYVTQYLLTEKNY